jgi:hypothetical protein
MVNIFFGIYLLMLLILFIGALWEENTPAESERPGNGHFPEIESPDSYRISRRLPRMDASAPLELRLYASCATRYHTMFDNAIKRIRLGKR